MARRPILAAAVSAGAVLTAFSGGYGYDRDELYFRMLRPAWGYADQPPLTPLVARAVTALLGDSTWAIRLPATLATMTAVVVVALITPELGGRRGAQALCAWTFAFAGIPLVFGHVLLTSSIDLPVWPAVVLMIMRAQLRRQPGWWPAAGLLIGLATYNKLLIALLVVALAAGAPLAGPRRVLRSRHVLTGAAVAVVVAAPNIAYQATHRFPQLRMGQALASENASTVRVEMWPVLLIALGFVLVPIWLAGVVGLLRRPQWRPVRFVGAAFPVLLVLVFVMGSQVYYPVGLQAVMLAAGAVPAWTWLARGDLRRIAGITLLAVNAAVNLLIALPLLPVTVVGATHLLVVDRHLRVEVPEDQEPAEASALNRFDDQLVAALGGLTETRRTAVVLRYYADLSHEQIGRAMQCSTSTARAHVHRGLADLRRACDREGEIA